MNAILSFIVCIAMLVSPTGMLPAQPETATTWTISDLTIAVGDVHSQQYRAMNKYRVEVYTDAGLVLRQELPQIKNTEYLSLDVDPNSRYYRVEIYNVTEDYIFAIGNPIWNLALYTGEVLQ
jgi:hypothetical protein